IDYGFLADELYSSRRMEGTYKCFYKHNLSSYPYENLGYQDITSDVNFSDLIQSGKELGFKEIKYINQGQFLIDWGMIDILEKYIETKYQNDRMSIKNLIMPEFMGSKFKFLLQAKNLDSKSAKIFYKEGDLRLIRKTP
ncbi:MAG: SAM-dependent methyltransferase, partial [Thermodesulfobacteriota bacterium]